MEDFSDASIVFGTTFYRAKSGMTKQEELSTDRDIETLVFAVPLPNPLRTVLDVDYNEKAFLAPFGHLGDRISKPEIHI